jgi:hypothetical protein
MNQRYDEDCPTEDDMETVHLYVYEERPKQPMRVTLGHLTQRLVQVVAIGMFMAFCLLPGSPVYALKVLRVPAHFLPVQVFRVESAIVPTGTLTHPATQAHGTLTVYNGLSVIQQLPAGVIVLTGNGREIATDQGVTISAAHLPVVGVATVRAHAVQAGSQGNIQAGAIDQDYGSSLTIKNLSAFQGGQDAYTEQIVTADDTQKALAEAREQLTQRRPRGLLARPCTERTTQAGTTLTVTWSCQYVACTAPRGVQVLAAHVEGKEIILQVRAIVLPS